MKDLQDSAIFKFEYDISGMPARYFLKIAFIDSSPIKLITNLILSSYKAVHWDDLSTVVSWIPEIEFAIKGHWGREVFIGTLQDKHDAELILNLKRVFESLKNDGFRPDQAAPMIIWLGYLHRIWDDVEPFWSSWTRKEKIALDVLRATMDDDRPATDILLEAGIIKDSDIGRREFINPQPQRVKQLIYHFLKFPGEQKREISPRPSYMKMLNREEMNLQYFVKYPITRRLQ